MRTTLSDAALTAMHAVSTDEVMFPLLKLSQEAWEEPILIVPNTESVMHMGEEYIPFAFELSLPDEEASGLPVLNWSADNTDRAIMAAIRSVTGFIQADVVWVLASSPDHIEMAMPPLEMRVVEYDAFQMSGVFALEPIMDVRFGTLTMNPKNTPALF